MVRSSSSSNSSSDESSSPSYDYKRNRKHKSRRSGSKVRDVSYIREPRTKKNYTPPPTPDKVQRLEKLVERLIEHSTNPQPGPSRIFIKPECIPEFRPGNPNLSCSKWLDKIEQLKEINRWDERATIFHMQNRLAGLARKWYDNLASYKMSWEEWKTLLLKSFPDNQDFATSLRKLMNRRKLPAESWEEYYFAKMDLVNACEISPKNAVSCLIDGIANPTIQVGARAGRYESPDALYAEYLSSLKPESTPMRLENAPTRFDISSTRKRFYSDNRRDEPSSKKSNSTKTDQKCYNCKQIGNFAYACTKPRIECTKCKRLGHSEKDCHRKAVKVNLSKPTTNHIIKFILSTVP